MVCLGEARVLFFRSFGWNQWASQVHSICNSVAIFCPFSVYDPSEMKWMKWCESSLKAARLLWDQANCDWQFVACWANHWWICLNQAKGWSKNVWSIYKKACFCQLITIDIGCFSIIWLKRQFCVWFVFKKTKSGVAKPYLCSAFGWTALPQWSIDVSSQSMDYNGELRGAWECLDRDPINRMSDAWFLTCQ